MIFLGIYPFAVTKIGGLVITFSVSFETGYTALIVNFPSLSVFVVNLVPGSGSMTLAPFMPVCL